MLAKSNTGCCEGKVPTLPCMIVSYGKSSIVSSLVTVKTGWTVFLVWLFLILSQLLYTTCSKAKKNMSETLCNFPTQKSIIKSRSLHDNKRIINSLSGKHTHLHLFPYYFYEN